MEYHVSVNGEDGAKGTEEYPFQSISRAAAVAVAGDTITVHAGIYREWVNPENGGTGEARIVYRAAGDGETVITGAEPIKEWKMKREMSGVQKSAIQYLPCVIHIRKNYMETGCLKELLRLILEMYIWMENHCMNVHPLMIYSILRYGRRQNSRRNLF